MFSTLSIGSARSHVTVVGVTSDGKTVPAAYATIQAVSDALETPGFGGENGEVLAAGTKHVLLGLGEPGSVTTASIRTAAAKLVKAALAMRALVVPALTPIRVAPTPGGSTQATAAAKSAAPAGVKPSCL